MAQEAVSVAYEVVESDRRKRNFLHYLGVHYHMALVEIAHSKSMLRKLAEDYYRAQLATYYGVQPEDVDEEKLLQCIDDFVERVHQVDKTKRKKAWL